MTRHERIFLGTILGPSQYIDPYETSGITAEMFTTRHGKAIYNAIGELLAKNIQPDLQTVFDIDKSIPTDVLGEVTDYNSRPHIEHAIDQIKLNYKIRILKKVSRIAGAVTWENYQETIEQISRGLEKLDDTEAGDDLVNVKEYFLNFINKIEDKYNKKGEVDGIQIKFKRLSELLYGFQNSKLYCIGARPSEGKSTLLMNLAWDALIDGYNVGFITIESGRDELINRIISHDSGIPVNRISTGMLQKSDFSGLTMTGEAFYKSNFIIYDKPNATIQEVKSAARQMKRKHKCQIIFIDYLQLVKIKSAKNRIDEVGETSRELKQLARALKLPVVVAAQLGRDADNKKPTLGDFQHSSQVEQDCDLALLIWNCKKIASDQMGNEIEEDDYYFIIDKNRDGAKGWIRMSYSKDRMTFEENPDQIPPKILRSRK